MAFEYKNNLLSIVSGKQHISLLTIAQKTKQAFYVYDLDGIVDRMKYFKQHTFPARPHYSMKANAHPEILKALCQQGVGVDVVSGGEVKMALQAGFLGKDIIFSGVGKTVEEIKQALKADILQFNVESVSELKRIIHVAKQVEHKARVAFRMNPNIDFNTHPYIKTGLREHKFGLDEENWPELQELLQSPFVCLHGLTLHIGSQIHDLQPLESSIWKIKSLYEKLKKDFNLQTFSVGGGLGVDYKKQSLESDHPLIEEYGKCLKKLADNLDGQILTEPGRIILARFGCLVGEVQYIKSNSYKNFAILNTGMHHLMRPCLYQAYHRIVPLEKKQGTQKVYDVVGPICESADVLGRDRVFTALQEQDFLAVLDTGAYGAVMAHTYNAQSLPKEIIISNQMLLS